MFRVLPWVGRCLALLCLPSIALGDPLQMRVANARKVSARVGPSSDQRDEASVGSGGSSEAAFMQRAAMPLRGSGRLRQDVSSAPDGMLSVVRPWSFSRLEVARKAHGDESAGEQQNVSAPGWERLDGRRDAVYAGEEGRPIRWRALFSEPIWLDGVSAWQGAVGQLRVFAGGADRRTPGSAGTGLGVISPLIE